MLAKRLGSCTVQRGAMSGPRISSRTFRPHVGFVFLRALIGTRSFARTSPRSSELTKNRQHHQFINARTVPELFIPKRLAVKPAESLSFFPVLFLSARVDKR